ncbi:uncharacterized protein METZ01_LOCUS414835, partial [marine metagenome]
FLCHFPSPSAASLPAKKPGSYPAPCPVEPGLSSPLSFHRRTRRRPPSIPAFSNSTVAYPFREGQENASGESPEACTGTKSVFLTRVIRES